MENGKIAEMQNNIYQHIAHSKNIPFIDALPVIDIIISGYIYQYAKKIDVLS